LFPDQPSDAPLILEIGFGYGHFLKHLSETRPEARIVGVEIANECLERVEYMRDRGRLPNVRVLFSRAESALHHLFEPASLDEIHVNFPDPWFKARHEQRRLLQRSNIDLFANRLKPGGKFFLATDIREYAEMSAEALAETSTLDNLLPAPWAGEMAGRVVTKYERKAHEEGRPSHFFAYKRNTTPALPIPVMKELEMPHIVIHLPLTPDEIVARFAPMEADNEKPEIHVALLHAYCNPRATLIEAHVVDTTIQQHIGLSIAQSGGDPHQVTVMLSPIGIPRPSDGAHFAVRTLANWLLTLHPDARILGDKTRDHLREQV
jgi:tRNA (guanine-N7-)-methyltransferase